MIGRPHRLAWVPPFLVGVSAAIVAEVAVGILLYAGPGFVRSLTVILAIEGVALAGGLWSAPAPGPDLVDRLRRRWLLCLVAFLVATLFGGAWSLLDVLGKGRSSQGLGLAILAAIPLYATGAVLGGMASITSSDPGGSRPGPGAAAAFGAGVGFLVTGSLLPRTPIPASLLIACLVMLSLGGMILGSVLGYRLEIRVRAERPARGGDVRVEDRRLASTGFAARVLLEGAHERRRLALSGDGEVPWDVAVARAMMPEPDRPWRLLTLGGGASTLARSVLREHPTGTVDVLERTGVIIEMGREHFDTELAIGMAERVTIGVGNLEDLVQGVRGPYDAVLIDASALAPIGGVRGLSRVARVRLVEAVGESGVLVWGPMPPEPGMPELVDGWTHVVFDRAVEGSDDEVVILTGRQRLAEVPRSFEGFVTRNGGQPAT